MHDDPRHRRPPARMGQQLIGQSDLVRADLAAPGLDQSGRRKTVRVQDLGRGVGHALPVVGLVERGGAAGVLRGGHRGPQLVGQRRRRQSLQGDPHVGGGVVAGGGLHHPQRPPARGVGELRARQRRPGLGDRGQPVLIDRQAGDIDHHALGRGLGRRAARRGPRHVGHRAREQVRAAGVGRGQVRERGQVPRVDGRGDLPGEVGALVAEHPGPLPGEGADGGVKVSGEPFGVQARRGLDVGHLAAKPGRPGDPPVAPARGARGQPGRRGAARVRRLRGAGRKRRAGRGAFAGSAFRSRRLGLLRQAPGVAHERFQDRIGGQDPGGDHRGDRGRGDLVAVPDVGAHDPGDRLALAEVVLGQRPGDARHGRGPERGGLPDQVRRRLEREQEKVQERFAERPGTVGRVAQLDDRRERAAGDLLVEVAQEPDRVRSRPRQPGQAELIPCREARAGLVPRAHPGGEALRLGDLRGGRAGRGDHVGDAHPEPSDTCRMNAQGLMLQDPRGITRPQQRRARPSWNPRAR